MKRGKLEFAILSLLVLIIGVLFFVSAVSPTINSNTGEAGVYNRYNISIINTDAGTNITQVNLTFFLSSFSTNSFNTDTNATITSSSPLWIFTNASDNLINGTSYGGITAGNFSFSLSTNITGVFNITVTTLDSSPALTSNNLTITISDTIDPSISFVSPTPSTGSSLDGSYIPINITASDSGSGLKNITIYFYNSTKEFVESHTGTSSPYFYNFTSLDDGTYYINATAFDNASNSASTSTKTIKVNTTTINTTIIPSCTPSWTCDWSDCVNNTQTKINCIDSNDCNVTTGRPTGNQTCVSCVTSWSCGNWTPITCSIGSNQTKICTDLNNCTAPTTQRRTCVLNSASNSNASGQSIFSSPSFLFFVVMGIIVLSVVGVLFALMRLKKKSALSNSGSDNSGYTTYSPRGPPPSSPPPGYSNPPRIYPNQPQNY